MSAYSFGLVLGALFSALLFSRVLFWFSRRRLVGLRRACFANAGSLMIILLVSAVVRKGLEWDAVALHVCAQGVWLGVDAWAERERPGRHQD